MLGAIAGDIIGSFYERAPIKTKMFPLFSYRSTFTDDTVLTVATAYAINNEIGYAEAYKQFARKYPDAGYGGSFLKWAMGSSDEPYNSWGNGAAMRVSPIGFMFNDIDEVLAEAKKSAEVTHDHPEGIKGAQAVALAIVLARNGESKEFIKQLITEQFGYDFTRTLDEIRPAYSFEVSAQKSVPEAIICFLESTNFEDAIRNAVSLGGDADTMACIAGGIAEAFYGGVPDKIAASAKELLPAEFIDILVLTPVKHSRT